MKDSAHALVLLKHFRVNSSPEHMVNYTSSPFSTSFFAFRSSLPFSDHGKCKTGMTKNELLLSAIPASIYASSAG